MFVFHPPIALKKRVLPIPERVSESAGLKGETHVMLSVCQDAGPSLVNELVIAPLPLSQSVDLWQMQGTFVDRPGIFARLASELRKLRVNIVTCRAQTREQRRLTDILLLLDCRHYRSEFDGDHAYRSRNPNAALRELRARILALFVDEIYLSQRHVPLLSIERSNRLDSTNPRVHLAERGVVSREGTIELPVDVFHVMRDSFSQLYPELRHRKGRQIVPLASLSADAVASVIYALLYYPGTGHVHLEVEARNTIGALAAVMSALTRSHLNLLRMQTHNVANGDRSITELLVHLPPELDKERSDPKLRRYLRGIFRGKDVRDFVLDVRFPSPIRNWG